MLEPRLYSEMFFGFSYAVNCRNPRGIEHLQACLAVVPEANVLLESDLDEPAQVAEQMLRSVCDLKQCCISLCCAGLMVGTTTTVTNTVSTLFLLFLFLLLLLLLIFHKYTHLPPSRSRLTAIVAAAKGWTMEETARITTANADRFYLTAQRSTGSGKC